ncbi:uncharacterized protein LOC108104771 [Drosophila eugracilis]|uniref:uncharacterized protein LOC108104771 n=1 Tax=Drosophila eugracilis TaxID=29029 RepID=UPI0007E79706|nr:uncharacterized protein LOC108104771 [Drosophila eugracilis]
MSVNCLKVLLILSIATYGVVVRAMLECRMESVSKIYGDNETLMEFNFRLIGRQRLINGTIIFHVDLNDDFQVSNEIYTHVDGEWQPSTIGVKYKACTYLPLIYDKYFSPSFKDTNFPTGKGSCPVKKGEYYMRNAEIIADNWASYARLGLVRTLLLIKRNNVLYGGLESLLVLSEKTF